MSNDDVVGRLHETMNACPIRNYSDSEQVAIWLSSHSSPQQTVDAPESPTEPPSPSEIEAMLRKYLGPHAFATGPPAAVARNMEGVDDASAAARPADTNAERDWYKAAGNNEEQDDDDEEGYDTPSAQSDLPLYDGNEHGAVNNGIQDESAEDAEDAVRLEAKLRERGERLEAKRREEAGEKEEDNSHDAAEDEIQDGNAGDEEEAERSEAQLREQEAVAKQDEVEAVSYWMSGVDAERQAAMLGVLKASNEMSTQFETVKRELVEAELPEQAEAEKEEEEVGETAWKKLRVGEVQWIDGVEMHMGKDGKMHARGEREVEFSSRASRGLEPRPAHRKRGGWKQWERGYARHQREIRRPR